MPKLAVLRGNEVVRALCRGGFVLKRVSGSHHILRHPDTQRVTSVPVHSADLKPGLLRGILSDAGISVDQFLDLLR